MKHDGYALVTGASRGLGMAFARELAQRNYNLVLVARSLEPLEALASELRAANQVSVVTIRADLSSSGGSRALAEAIADNGIPIDLLINNAGFGLRGEFRTLSLSRQLEMIQLNNQAIVELTYSLLPAMFSVHKKASLTSLRRQAFSPFPSRRRIPQPKRL
jgi:short-subunit dehydrogenase